MKTGISFKVIELSLNNFCKLSCVGCSSLGDDSTKRLELNFLKVFEKIKNYSVDQLVLCGNSGEPLEHSGISEILLSLAGHFRDSQIHVSTNGEGILHNISLETLREISGNTVFQVALDGPNQEIHQLTRVGGSFKKVIETLKALKTYAVPFEVIYTRHLENESYAQETARMVRELLGVEISFRDTTIIARNIRAPLHLSKSGNVSILYNKNSKDSLPEFKPNFKYLYIDHSGECYPCVSFVKYKTALRPPNIYQETSWIAFTKSFLDFQQSFCHTYQKEGDLRQCALNCGIYKNFQYDSALSLRVEHSS
jgi:MoaA/NifB/PqqE/SkfB family radical SAM enzyme